MLWIILDELSNDCIHMVKVISIYMPDASAWSMLGVQVMYEIFQSYGRDVWSADLLLAFIFAFSLSISVLRVFFIESQAHHVQ